MPQTRVYYFDPDTQIPGGSRLGPETVRSIEGTIEERFGAQTVSVGVFESWWNDLILIQELSDAELQAAIDAGRLSPNAEYAYQSRNVSRIESWGYNLAYDGSTAGGRLHYGASFTEAIARRIEPGMSPDLLAVAPQSFGNARIAYDLSDGLPTLGLAARWISRRPTGDYPDAREYASPGFEVRATVSGAVPAVSGLSYRVTANVNPVARGAYRTGPPLNDGRTELVPNEPLRFGVGLAYDLPL